MNKTFNTQNLMQISLFEKYTKAKVKDCFEDKFGQLTFCVYKGQLFNALGKNSSKIKKIDQMFKRKVRVIEFNPKIEEFVKNICYPNKVEKVEYGEQHLWDKKKKIVLIHPESVKSRGYIIGKNGENLRNMEFICNRYFKVDEIKVTSKKEDEEIELKIPDEDENI
ncbi:MAG: NusA-like transcription termination signal-binding factor [Nanobdellota archaeon]